NQQRTNPIEGAGAPFGLKESMNVVYAPGFEEPRVGYRGYPDSVRSPPGFDEYFDLLRHHSGTPSGSKGTQSLDAIRELMRSRSLEIDSGGLPAEEAQVLLANYTSTLLRSQERGAGLKDPRPATLVFFLGFTPGEQMSSQVKFDFKPPSSPGEAFKVRLEPQV